MSDGFEAALAAVEAANAPEAGAEPGKAPAGESDAGKGGEEALELTPDQELHEGGDPEGGEEGEEGDGKTRKRRSKPASERIAELTARLRNTERELTALKGGGDQPDREPAAPEKPNPADFEFGEADPEYIDKLTDWKIEARDAEREQAKKTQLVEQAAVDRLRTGLAVAEEKAKAKYADFDDRLAEAVEARGGDPLPPLLSVALGVSPVGGDLIYRLATDDAASEKLERLAKAGEPGMQAMAMAFGELEGEYVDGDDDADLDLTDALDMARMLGRMRARLKGTRAAPREDDQPAIAATKAPEPPAQRARGGSGRTKVAPDTDDTAAFLRDYGKQLGL